MLKIWPVTGRHRAVDEVRRLTAERDYLLAALTKQDGQLKVANAQTLQLCQRIDDLTIENGALRDAYKLISLPVAFSPNPAVAA